MTDRVSDNKAAHARERRNSALTRQQRDVPAECVSRIGGCSAGEKMNDIKRTSNQPYADQTRCDCTSTPPRSNMHIHTSADSHSRVHPIQGPEQALQRLKNRGDDDGIWTVHAPLQ